MRAWLASKGIVTEGWRPLGGSERPMDQIITHKIANRLGVHVSQVVLRWAVQQGAVVIPSSGKPERWHSNADLFSFELTEQDMIDLATLDLGEDAAGTPTPTRSGEGQRHSFSWILRSVA